jgi:hypothetical protein
MIYSTTKTLSRQLGLLCVCGWVGVRVCDCVNLNLILDSHGDLLNQ